MAKKYLGYQKFLYLNFCCLRRRFLRAICFSLKDFLPLVLILCFIMEKFFFLAFCLFVVLANSFSLAFLLPNFSRPSRPREIIMTIRKKSLLKKQCFGSALVSMRIRHCRSMRIRMWIRCGFDPDPDPNPGFRWSKLFYKIFFFVFLWIKFVIYIPLCLHKKRPSYRRSLQPSKENIQHLTKINAECGSGSETLHRSIENRPLKKIRVVDSEPASG